MAFQNIRPASITDCLIALDPPIRKNKNLVRYLTVGLTDCYSSIAHQPTTSVAGTLCEQGSSSNALCVRQDDNSYIDDAQIGSGSFSVVTRSHDWSGQVFAVKRVLGRFLLLALREVIFLRHLQQRTLRGGHFCESASPALHYTAIASTYVVRVVLC
jgi:hypothetical protein